MSSGPSTLHDDNADLAPMQPVTNVKVFQESFWQRPIKLPAIWRLLFAELHLYSIFFTTYWYILSHTYKTKQNHQSSFTAICCLKSSTHIPIHLQDIQTLDQLEHCLALSNILWKDCLGCKDTIKCVSSSCIFYMCKPKHSKQTPSYLCNEKKKVFSSCWIA